jgi:hypothetical protein
MNLIKILSLVIFVALVTVACQFAGFGGSATNSPGPEPATSYPPSEIPAYPYPLPTIPSETYSYPYPPSDVSPNLIPTFPSVLYPDAKDGDEVSWDQAVSMILNDEVSKVMQTHDLKAYLTLKDGRTLVTTQPGIDEVIKVVEKCGDKCKNIRIATE